MFPTCISCLCLFSKIVNKIVRVLAYIFFFKLKIHLSYPIYYFERQRLTLGLHSHTKKNFSTREFYVYYDLPINRWHAICTIKNKLDVYDNYENFVYIYCVLQSTLHTGLIFLFVLLDYPPSYLSSILHASSMLLLKLLFLEIHNQECFYINKK